MKSSNIAKYIGIIVVVFAIILMISGASLFMSNFFIGPDVGMTSEDFLAAMNESSTRAITGMTLLTIGSFSLMAGICLTYYGYGSNISMKFTNENKKKIYAHANPIIKGNEKKSRIICRFCQSEIEEGENICHKCGTEI